MDLSLTPDTTVEVDIAKKHRFGFNPKIVAGVVAGITATVAAALTIKAKKSDEPTDEPTLDIVDPYEA